LLHQRRYRPAGAALRQSLRFYEELGDPAGLAECLVACAALAGAQRDYETAARRLGTLDALLSSGTFHLAPVEQQEYERCKAEAQSALDAVTWREAWAAGQARTVAQVIADLE
jgi:hypothetical protein